MYKFCTAKTQQQNRIFVHALFHCSHYAKTQAQKNHQHEGNLFKKLRNKLSSFRAYDIFSDLLLTF